MYIVVISVELVLEKIFILFVVEIFKIDFNLLLAQYFSLYFYSLPLIIIDLYISFVTPTSAARGYKSIFG